MRARLLQFFRTVPLFSFFDDATVPNLLVITSPISVAQSVFCFHLLIFLPIGFFWKPPADWRKTACAVGIFGLSWRPLRGLSLLQRSRQTGW